MSAELLYARYGIAQTQIHLSTLPGAVGRVLIYDLVGEVRAPTLRDRLGSLDSTGRYEDVLLRGSSEYLRAEVSDGQGLTELVDRFGPEARLWWVDVETQPRVEYIGNGPPPAAGVHDLATRLLSQCAQVEMEAALMWSNAIWSGPSLHFVAPSGQHVDKFIRVGDVFADPINVTRLADWCWGRDFPPAVVVADNFTLLPLLQEIQLRSVRQRDTEPLRFLLPLYGTPDDVVRELLSQIVPAARESRSPILVLVSVTASGGYIKEFSKGLATFEQAPRAEFLPICGIGESARAANPICYVPAEQYADSATCRFCRDGISRAIEIDQRSFVSRLGIRVLDIPKLADLEESNLIIAEGDQHKAFRLHVNRTERHGHLTIFMDTARLLKSAVFRARITIGLARARMGFAPDLVLVPKHEFTDALSAWLKGQGVDQVLEVVLDEPLPGATRQAIVSAQKILLCDDAVITGRTMHALLELVQREKGTMQDSDFRIRAFVMIARPAWASAWNGLSDRFFINHQRCLFAGWEVNLSDVGSAGREVCPWCQEEKMLRAELPQSSESTHAYIERRIAFLSESSGLTGGIYLGAESDVTAGGWNAAVHTTPSSYLGDVSDVGAYVACSALLQRMRDTWTSGRERWSTSYAIPLHTFLRRFTDPVIAAAFLRGVRAEEVSAFEMVSEVERAVNELDHSGQSPVLVAELLLAGKQKKLPYAHVHRIFADRLGLLPSGVGEALTDLFRAPVVEDHKD